MDELLERARKRGSDKAFRLWVTHQPSCVSDRFSTWIDGVGRNDAAHHRTAANSGTATKPEYSAVPLTREEHLRQHAHGASVFGDRDWWNNQVRIHLERWIAS